jgi:hypothetical protein
MRDRVPCEFFLVRYVPDVVKGEFVNIGVVLRGLEPAAALEPLRLRFTRDWTRVRCIDAGADIALLEALEDELTRRLGQAGQTRDAREPAALLPLLESSLSNSIQMTEPRAALAENLTTELEQLMTLYVEPMRPPRAERAVKTVGRPAIQSSMRTHFERAGVWAMMNKRVPAERYTRPGDPMRIDCGYRRDARDSTGEAIRMFQAISLAGDGEMAKVLAFMSPRLRDGVARVEKTPLELTAVVEPLRAVADEEGELEERYRFGVETMEQSGIRVVTVNDLARVAATAQRELGL